ncbi:hypothetical protein ACFVT5_42110 [Streptomyces sp. NPDC058001]|uniref:hypothetical protein n=1 Tax=Streptomyces sp. NPDC058001 TaxID=3346300 RepID=UPI0036EB1089
MPENLPPCPHCSSAYTYEMGALLICLECAHEWSPVPTGSAGGLVPAGDPDDIIEVAEAEFQDRFDAWIRPLIPDAVPTRSPS